MSNGVSSIELQGVLAPTQTVTLTSASSALRTASQGQFQSVDATTAILLGTGSSVLRVRCKPANTFGRVDSNSPVTVRIHAGQNVTKPTAAAIGTLLHADANGVDCTATVLPGANGVVDISFTLAAADATCRASLFHRHYAVSSLVAVT